GGEPEAGEDDAFELTLEAPQPEEGPPPAEQDELLLDASRLAEADEPVQAAVGGRRRRMLGGAAEGEEAEEAAPAPAPRSAPGAGSTLFERMANLSRASATSDDEIGRASCRERVELAEPRGACRRTERERG